MIKNLPANIGDTGLIPGLGRSPREGNCNPLQYSCLENSMDGEPGRQQSMGSQRVRHNWVTSLHKIIIGQFIQFLKCLSLSLIVQKLHKRIVIAYRKFQIILSYSDFQKY